MKTKTASFGTTKREGHDSTIFYSRNLYKTTLFSFNLLTQTSIRLYNNSPTNKNTTSQGSMEKWVNRIYCHTSENMHHIPDNSIALAFTSPPYNAGKEYDEDLDLNSYLELIMRVGREVYRVLKPGGRYVINIANLGRKPYIPLHAYFYMIHTTIGFLPLGEIIWIKGKGASGSCAWGSWLSAKAPRLRDLHEYLLVFVKEKFERQEKGQSDITRDEFLSSTLSVWEIPPESAKKVGHPAPFPVELAARVIKLFSYVNDVVLDPFCGSGTTLVAAKKLNRKWVGYDIVPEYCVLAEKRIQEADKNAK